MTDGDFEEHKASIHPQQLAGMQRQRAWGKKARARMGPGQPHGGGVGGGSEGRRQCSMKSSSTICVSGRGGGMEGLLLASAL